MSYSGDAHLWFGGSTLLGMFGEQPSKAEYCRSTSKTRRHESMRAPDLRLGPLLQAHVVERVGTRLARQHLLDTQDARRKTLR